MKRLWIPAHELELDDILRWNLKEARIRAMRTSRSGMLPLEVFVEGSDTPIQLTPYTMVEVGREGEPEIKVVGKTVTGMIYFTAHLSEETHQYP